jgi:hypothetical protein
VSQPGDIGGEQVVTATPSGAGKTWPGLLYVLAMLVLGILLTFGLYALIVLVGPPADNPCFGLPCGLFP